MITLLRTNSSHPDFKSLVQHLDVYLAEMDGEAHNFYSQYNKIDNLKEVVLAYKNNEAIACGAFKLYDTDIVEIKRMYVNPICRGEGVASMVLMELEDWAKELGFKQAVLETGSKYKDAIALYLKNGYEQIPNYGQYVGSNLSTCFKKTSL